MGTNERGFTMATVATNGKAAALIGIFFLCGCMLSGPDQGLGQAKAPTTKPATESPAKPAGELTADQAAAAADAAVRKRLAPKVNKLDFDDIEFKDVIQFLRDVSGLSIHVKWSALSLAGVDRKTPVNIHLNDVTMGKALRVILDDIGGGNTKVDYLVDEGVVTISTAEDLSRYTVTRTYPAGDLVFQIWQGTNLDFAPWKRDPFDLGKHIRKSWPQTQPAAGEGQFRHEPPCGQTYAPLCREEAWAELSGLITELVDPTSWRKSGGEIGTVRAMDSDLVITQTRKSHELIEALLAQLRSDKTKIIPLGVAVLRLDDPDNLDALRQLAGGSKDFPKDLREGERQEKWGLERCEVELARLGRPIVIRRLEQTVLEGGRGPNQPPAVLTAGYEAGILPLREDKGVLAVSLACSAGWIVPPPEEGPKPPLSVRSVRRVYESTVLARGSQVVQVAPLEAEGGGVFLVIWRAEK